VLAQGLAASDAAGGGMHAIQRARPTSRKRSPEAKERQKQEEAVNSITEQMIPLEEKKSLYEQLLVLQAEIKQLGNNVTQKETELETISANIAKTAHQQEQIEAKHRRRQYQRQGDQCCNGRTPTRRCRGQPPSHRHGQQQQHDSGRRGELQRQANGGNVRSA
jgi:chromosome segregation ATPase